MRTTIIRDIAKEGGGICLLVGGTSSTHLQWFRETSQLRCSLVIGVHPQEQCSVLCQKRRNQLLLPLQVGNQVFHLLSSVWSLNEALTEENSFSSPKWISRSRENISLLKQRGAKMGSYGCAHKLPQEHKLCRIPIPTAPWNNLRRVSKAYNSSSKTKPDNLKLEIGQKQGIQSSQLVLGGEGG